MSDHPEQNTGAGMTAAGAGAGLGQGGSSAIPGHHPGALAAVASSAGQAEVDAIGAAGNWDPCSPEKDQSLLPNERKLRDYRDSHNDYKCCIVGEEFSATPPTPEGDLISIPRALISVWYDAAGELLQECYDWLKLKHGNHPSAAGLNFGETDRRRELARLLFLDLAWLSGGSDLDAAPDRLASLPASQAQGEEGARIGWNAAIAWVEKHLADYVAECGIYDPSTGVTEFSDGGEWESSIQDIIDGMRLAMPSATPAPVSAGVESLVIAAALAEFEKWIAMMDPKSGERSRVEYNISTGLRDRVNDAMVAALRTPPPASADGEDQA